ncbi:MAG TPA: DUF2147 domain-containing protein [Methylomirabilota bacterium]|nr:DUF2147 domain-containing protein [Methylomirabilota bacterium]
MKRFAWIVMLSVGLAALGAAAAEAPVGQWKTIDEKSGAVQSVVAIYDQGGKLFGKIVSLTQPVDAQGKPKICVKCTGDDKDKPIVGLVIIKDLSADGDHWKGGTILDPDDGKVYKAELWVEEGKLKVRGYLGFFHRTQAWAK